MKSPFSATLRFPTAFMMNTLTLCQPNYFLLKCLSTSCFLFFVWINDDVQLLSGSHRDRPSFLTPFQQQN
ncbi:hypothetical protein GHT06_021292 [Daphnia sinensis]|uniref:Uncharacterized protein n=1 Tax=Daphnia sinensis TaxID=1820382 RepID=A0AAD5L034_9CRUS|nr:hypothetical protein GHT06_021292 [Daphnia sinensis]